MNVHSEEAQLHYHHLLAAIDGLAYNIQSNTHVMQTPEQVMCFYAVADPRLYTGFVAAECNDKP